MKTSKDSSSKSERNNESVLVSLDRVYTSTDTLNLCILSKNFKRLKNITTEEIKDLEGEVALLDILLGKVQYTIDEKIISDLRQYFNITRQIGYGEHFSYDFLFKQKKDCLYKLSTLINIQKDFLSSDNYTEF